MGDPRHRSTARAFVRRYSSIAFAALIAVPAVALAASPAAAVTFTTYTVNSTSDATDGAGSGLCATQPPTTAAPCTLRAAIAEANALSGVTINLPVGTFTLSAGVLAISKPMTIVGAKAQPGASATTIDGAAKDRVFSISATGVTIDGVVVRNGFQSKGDGGGILLSKNANLTLKRSTISGNKAVNGAGIEVDGSATISQTTFQGNTATGKGGGLYVSATANIQNSTFDGNSANGGGGIASPGTTNLTASTVTNNNSNNSNGGGLYRVGGTFNVTSSIVASNNAGTGRDCYGSPTFIGTNILQFTPGCNPSGGIILVVDPLLGALGDNGGATQTRRPLGGSAAVDAYALPCATSVDQREVARPQPALGRCDVGAVEKERLGLDLTLASSSETIGVGTGTVGVGNIPPSALLPTPSSTSTTQDSGVRYSGIRYSGVRYSGVRYSGVRYSGVRYSGVRYSGVRYSGVRYSDAESALVAAGIPDPLGTISVADLTLDLPGGFPALLIGSQFENTPLESITLADIMPLIESAGITLDQLDLSDTTLGSLPYVSLLLGPVPMKKIPLTAALVTGTDQQRLAAWCAALTVGATDPCAELGADPNSPTPSSITPLAVSLGGFSLDGVALTSILAKDVAGNDAEWFKAMPLGNFGFANTSLKSLLISTLPPAWVQCNKLPASIPCSTATLGDAAIYGAIVDTISLFDLFTNAATVGLPKVAVFTFGDLLQGLIPPELLPWNSLDLAYPLQNVATPTEPVLTYTMSINIKGDTAAATSVKFTLPPGFVVVPGTFTVDAATKADPTVTDGIATLNLGTLAPGQHTATIGTRAGLTLGAATATADGTATVGTGATAETATASSSKTVTVVESFENAGTPTCGDLDACDTKTLVPDTLYVGHISTPTDRDLYRFNVPAPSAPGRKTVASIVLSNLPADYDLALYGPKAAFIRGEPQQSLEPVNDSAISLDPTSDHLSPDTVRDVPLTPPAYAPGVIQVAANRGNVEELIDTGSLAPGDYAVQVSGYNGANSPKPYSLRMMLIGKTPLTCRAPTRPNSDAGPLATVTTLGLNPHVLFIVPQHHLYQTFGTRTDAVIAKVQALAQNLGGTILAVDNVAEVASAYNAWDTNHCDPNAANAVVRAIGAQIDQARATNASIDSIVLVGDDSVLPMARIPDRTRIANETAFADTLASVSGTTLLDNELSGSLSDGYFLTDDAYGTARGISVDEHEMFVPDVALGRLVETPEDIATAMQTFLDNDGTLDPSTASSALVTGYDFATDGAQDIASALTANGKNVDTSLINDTWSGSDLTSKLLGGTAPGITSFNGHFDQTKLLAGNGTDLVKSSVLTNAANLSKLARRLLFSMGCHSGLSVSDVSVGTQLDWPQAVTGLKQGGLYAGNTGYGYGDDTSVALSERLMALYAQALDGSVSSGRALMIAKQQYAATTAVLTPYDEKVMQESTFYGLPIYELASAVPTSNATVQALTMSASSNSGPGTTITGTDPRTGLPVAPITVPLPESSLTLHATGSGSYYDVNGEKIMAQYRPIEPMTSLDVTQANKRAHGVLITSLASNDKLNFTPKYFRPNLDNSASEQLTAPIGDSVFPSSLARVTRAIGLHGTTDRALLTAGQARDPQGNGNVTQRLFSSIGGVVEYGTTGDTDFTAPTIFRSRGEIVGTTAGFTVDTDGTALRAYVLYKPVGANGVWRGTDLTATNLPDGTKRWFGGGPIVGDNAEFFVQVLDASGNVGVSNNKVSNFLASRLSSSGLAINVVPPSGVTPVNGWFSTTLPITAFVTGGTGITYSLDGADFASYPSTGIVISGNGVHHVIALDASNNTAVVDVLIDASGPTITPLVDPGSSNATTDAANKIWYDGPVSLNLTADDGVIGSGVASIAYHAGNAADTVVTDASNPALVRSPLGTASTSVGVSSDATYTYKATDVAGNSSANGTTTINIDTAGPAPNCVVPNTGTWYQANVTVTCHPTDGGVGLASAADATVTLSTTVAQGTQTSTASTGSHQVCDRLNHCITIGPFTFKVDEQAPTIAGTVQPGTSTSAQDASNNTWYNGPVNLHLVGDDGNDGSDIDSITYASTGKFTVPSTTVNASTADVNVTPTGDGGSTVTYTARDVAGNNSATGTTGISIDTSAPSVSCTLPNQSTWYSANVTVNCTTTDNGVGLAVGTSTIFTLTTSVAPGAQNASAPLSTQQVCDRLAHCITAGAGITFKVDRQAPSVTITSPTNGASYAPGQNVAAAFVCSDGTDGSGIASCVGTVASGSAIDTTPGTHVFSVTGRDTAGNVTTASVTYSVGFAICLNYDSTKPQSLGGTVVIKVQLCDASGNNLSSPNITLTAIAQDILDPPQLPSPNFQGNSNNGYDFRFSAGQYVYNLDPTQPLPNGTMLGSGSHVLYFVVMGTSVPVYQAPFVLK